MTHVVPSFQPSERAIRIREVCDKTGISRSHLYRLIAIGQFPSPIQISERISIWREADVDRWLREKFLPVQDISSLDTSASAKESCI